MVCIAALPLFVSCSARACSSSLLGVGGGKEALEGPILLGRLVFAMELARLQEHTLNARRRGRALTGLGGLRWRILRRPHN